MNNAHRKTLELIFSRPTSPNVKWSRVVSLLNELGATVDQKRSGSRVGMKLNGVIYSAHKPHGPNMVQKAVDELREFLIRAGVKP
jgi:hypothetical protein